MAAITRLRVWDRPVRAPRYRSLSVIDERHFCNDSPTCDFSILERGRGLDRGTSEDVPRHLNAADVQVVHVKSIIVLSSSVMRERLGKYCNNDEMTLHIAYLLAPRWARIASRRHRLTPLQFSNAGSEKISFRARVAQLQIQSRLDKIDHHLCCIFDHVQRS